ncbi:MAG TPA: protein-glutamate O-methyltransferase CheR [Polyangiaceae bacterium]|nr:protein-glutamate O-methyltransferase CheR [Polyangiaceae bacterium]
MTLASGEFELVRSLLARETSIVLVEEQRYLVESRLASLARSSGFDGVEALMTRLPCEARLRQRVVDALTIHETSFFRDQHPFEALEQVVFPELLLKRSSERRLSVWSAAASSGQEAYSVAMLLLESFPLTKNWNVSIVGTDISDSVLSQARAGVYSPLEVTRGLPSRLLLRYFQRSPVGWIARPELRKLLTWQVMNLTRIEPSFLGFDVVLLRNVLIYFDLETRRRILSEMARRVRPGGYLLLGSTESVGGCREWTPRVVDKTVFYTRAV